MPPGERISVAFLVAARDDRAEEARTMPEEITCPNCGTMVPVADAESEAATFCLKCHNAIDSTTQRPSLKQRMFGLLFWMAVTFGIGLVFFLFLIPAQQNGEPNRRSSCRNNLKQIGLALLSYQESQGSFPPFHFTDSSGVPTHSWRAMLLPFIEEDAISELYDFSEPWNAPKNSQAIRTRVPSLICPALDDRQGLPLTSYIALPGQGRLFDGTRATRIEDITDGIENTIAVVECPRSQAWWADPRDGQWAKPMSVDDFLQLLDESGHKRINVVFADSHVEVLPDDLDAKTLEAMLTIAGGEKVMRP